MHLDETCSLQVHVANILQICSRDAHPHKHHTWYQSTHHASELDSDSESHNPRGPHCFENLQNMKKLIQNNVSYITVTKMNNVPPLESFCKDSRWRLCDVAVSRVQVNVDVNASCLCWSTDKRKWCTSLFLYRSVKCMTHVLESREEYNRSSDHLRTALKPQLKLCSSVTIHNEKLHAPKTSYALAVLAGLYSTSLGLIICHTTKSLLLLKIKLEPEGLFLPLQTCKSSLAATSSSI